MFKDISGIIFDFDGTLVLTNDFKKNLYIDLFSSLDESYLGTLSSKVNELYGNAPRKEIIESIVNSLFEEDSIIVETYLSKYKLRYVDFASKCEQIPGTFETLEKLSQNIPLYICTSNPDEDIIKIINNRRWSDYFHKIYGSSMTKKAVINDIICTKNFKPSQVLMVGDSDEDYQASEKCNVNFAGIVNSGSNFSIKPKYIYSSIWEMAEFLNFS